jgi:ABC-type Na+ efflux pump permease subunit
MDVTNPEMWKQEWTAFTSAPFIMLAGIMVVGVAAWWLSGKMSEAQVAGLKAEISAWDQRLKLAADLVAASDRAKDELEKQFQAYKEEVSIEGRNASSAKVDAAIVGVGKSNTEIRSKLVNALTKLEADRRVAPFITIDTTKTR